MKELKLWNGRHYAIEDPSDPFWHNVIYAHVYIAAYSRIDACRLILEYRSKEKSRWQAGTKSLDRELKLYFSNLWGNEMNGIKPTRGIWVKREKIDKKPVKLWPNKK